MPYDYPDNTQTEATVTVGGSFMSNIQSNGDRDWFAVTLNAGQTYQFDLEGTETGAGNLTDPCLRGIYDAGGNLIDGTRNDDGGAGFNSRVTFTATDTATYYVSAGASRGHTGYYTLSVTDVTEGVPDDFMAGTGTDGVVAVDGSATGDIEFYGDRDWFAVTLVAGNTYRFDLEGISTRAGTIRDPYLYGIYDAGGNRIDGTSNDGGGTGRNSRVTFTATDAATYYVSAGASGHREGTYKLSVTDITDGVPDDFTAAIDTDGVVAVGHSVTGRIESDGDRDWFAVTLVAGNTYRFDLEGFQTYDGTLRDPYLRGIYDAAGTLIDDTTNDNGGTFYNSRVVFTATDAATYYVSAGASANEEGTYTLSVTDITDRVSNDLAAGIDTTGVVTVGHSVAGDIETYGDRDWFSVALEAGKTYWFDLEGSVTGGGSLTDPYLRGIYDAAGTLVGGTTNNDGGYALNSRVVFTAADAATYYVSAGASGNREGTYTLSVRELADDFTAGTGTTGLVTVGGSATGNIDFRGDRDWFSVALEAGKNYQFDLEGRILAGTLYDPYLHGIYDVDGDYIAGTTNNNGGIVTNSRVTFAATDNATYYVSAGAYGNLEGTYRLSVREIAASVPDDFTAGTGTDGEVAVGDSVTGAIELAGDRDWFSVTLDAGNTYLFDLEGSRIGTQTGCKDPYLYGIYDAGGNPISGTRNDDGGIGLNSQVKFTATDDATYYVSAGAFGNREGAYTLSVTDITDGFPGDLADGTGTTGTVAVGGSAATGEIDFNGDRDWFAVTLVAGNTYRFNLEGTWTDSGTLRDTYLYGIYDANGNLISGTTDDDSGSRLNSRVTFTATDDAVYYVSAGAYEDNRGTYALSVEEVM